MKVQNFLKKIYNVFQFLICCNKFLIIQKLRFLIHFHVHQNIQYEPGADLGGGGGGGGENGHFSGIRPPADPKGPPFGTFWEIHFWLTDSKLFLKAPLAPIYKNFEGSARQKITRFFVKTFQKVPKNGFFDLFFFSKICLRRRKFGQNSVFLVL